MNDDKLTIIHIDGTTTEVEHPFEPLQLVILARLMRFGTIFELMKNGTFSKEDAKEILNGPLDPDDQTTVYDDSGLVDCESIEEAQRSIELGSK
jgi:hypothetical protein